MYIYYHDSVCLTCLNKPLSYLILSYLIKFLGITISSNLKAKVHVDNIIHGCNKLFYILHMMKAHGLPAITLHDVFTAIIVGHMTYAVNS